jgi:hypothetical protein
MTNSSGATRCGAIRQQRLRAQQQIHANEAEVEHLEVSQSAVDDSGGGRGGAAAEVLLLEQRDARSPRNAASRAIPQPMMPPPPITITSKRSRVSSPILDTMRFYAASP